MVLGKDTGEMKVMQKLYRECQKKGNVEKFYTQYFSEIPPIPTRYFPGLSEKTATLLATRVADHMLFLAKKDNSSVDVDPSARSGNETTTVNSNLSESEIIVLPPFYIAYLGAVPWRLCFHNLYKKLKNSPNWKSPECHQAISILEAARVTDIEVSV